MGWGLFWVWCGESSVKACDPSFFSSISYSRHSLSSWLAITRSFSFYITWVQCVSTMINEKVKRWESEYVSTWCQCLRSGLFCSFVPCFVLNRPSTPLHLAPLSLTEVKPVSTLEGKQRGSGMSSENDYY